MSSFYRRACLLSLCFLPAYGQTATPGYGWSSFGVLPFRGYDFVIAKAPTQYVAYYTRHPKDTVGEGMPITVGRAYSTDLKTWTEDTGDICATSGELCKFSQNRAGVLQLPDGRMRMFVNSGNGLSSLISTDGVLWTAESGLRFAADSSSIYERGNFALQLASFVNLPDGSVRMYYIGGVVPGSTGTPAWYNNMFSSGTVLSALSKDNGVTWVREPGVRVNPLVHGPVTTLTIAGALTDQYSGDDVTAVSVKENGRTIYRLYCPSLSDGTVSYVSDDGLSFTLEGQVPADRGDAKALVLPDGRTWLITNQYPDAVNDTIVYGPQTVFIDNVRAEVGTLPMSGFAKPFESALLGVTGTSTTPVTLEAATAAFNCPSGLCSFLPQYFSFSPATGTPPFTTKISFAGPAGWAPLYVVAHAKGSNATTAGAVFCAGQVLGRSDTTVFCKQGPPNLPMNSMSFSFSGGSTAAVSQTSNILTPGGHGYPFAVTSSVPWATVSPASGVAPMPISVQVNPAGLAPGTYSGLVTVSAEGTTQRIAVTATVSTGPVITGIQNAANSFAGIAPNGFLSIYGSGFAASAVSWAPVDTLPSSLGGVSVKVNGKPGFISYAGPQQLNVLLPQDVGTGSVPVEVTSASGTATMNANIAPAAPSWFSYSNGGATWAAALIANTATLVAPTGAFPGTSSRPAKAGDFLALYANGLGATSPPPPSGTILNGAYALDDFAHRVRMTIDGTETPVLFAGLVGAGLFQINVQVPAGLGTGELQVMLMVDGKSTPGGVTLNFQ